MYIMCKKRKEMRNSYGFLYKRKNRMNYIYICIYAQDRKRKRGRKGWVCLFVWYYDNTKKKKKEYHKKGYLIKLFNY